MPGKQKHILSPMVPPLQPRWPPPGCHSPRTCRTTSQKASDHQGHHRPVRLAVTKHLLWLLMSNNTDRTNLTISLATLFTALLSTVHLLSGPGTNGFQTATTTGSVLYVGWIAWVIVHYHQDIRPWVKRQKARDLDQDNREQQITAARQDLDQRAHKLAMDVEFAMDNDQIKCSDPVCIDRIAKGILNPVTLDPCYQFMVGRDFTALLQTQSLIEALGELERRHGNRVDSYVPAMRVLEKTIRLSGVTETKEWTSTLKTVADEARASLADCQADR